MPERATGLISWADSAGTFSGTDTISPNGTLLSQLARLGGGALTLYPIATRVNSHFCTGD